MCYAGALSTFLEVTRMVDLPDGFDLAALLEPIPGDAPQGTDIREDFSAQSPYNRLRDARSEARDAEKLQDAEHPDARDPAPLWRIVRDVGLKTLTENAKDLEVAAWLTESYVRSHGLSGLAAGAQLIRGLAEQYWDGLFPLPDEYGVETRVAPVSGLNGRDGNGSLIQPLYKVTLFTRPDGTPVAFYQYEASTRLQTLDAEHREQRIAAGAIPFDVLEKDARAGGSRAMAQLRDEANAALQAWEAMAAVLDEKASDDPPSTSHVRDLLRQFLDIANRYAPAEPAADGIAAGADGEDTGGTAVAVGGGTVPGFAASQAAMVSREDALRVLENIATYFRKTEPHSPLAYTLDEAVRRGRLTWPELLEEVVADRDSRNSILSHLGIRPPPPPDGE